MYFLWEHGKIQKPSDYWNMRLGDKIVTRAFYEYYVDSKHRKIKNVKDVIPVYPIQF
jgi:hypothetical protein